MIEGTQCPACGRASVPGEPRCLACRSPTEPATFKPWGQVLARTRLEPAGPGVVLVELEDGARVLARAGGSVPVGGTVHLRLDGDGFEAQPAH